PGARGKDVSLGFLLVVPENLGSPPRPHDAGQHGSHPPARLRRAARRQSTPLSISSSSNHPPCHVSFLHLLKDKPHLRLTICRGAKPPRYPSEYGLHR